MKFLILLLTLSNFLLAGDFPSTSENINHYKQMDKSYDESELNTKKDCDVCGTPAILLPYHGEDIPLAKTFPCIKGCPTAVIFEE